MDRQEAGITPGGVPQADLCAPLIRSSHLFCNAVREVLEGTLFREISGGGITPRQLRLLTFVGLAQHHVDDVARFLDVSGPAATRAVDTLERRGLVERHSSRTDRRLRVLALSTEGRRLVARFRAMQARRLAELLAEFPAEEMVHLSRLLEQSAVALIAGGLSASAWCLRCGGHAASDCPLQSICSNRACCPPRRVNAG